MFMILCDDIALETPSKLEGEFKIISSFLSVNVVRMVFPFFFLRAMLYGYEYDRSKKFTPGETKRLSRLVLSLVKIDLKNGI